MRSQALRAATARADPKGVDLAQVVKRVDAGHVTQVAKIGQSLAGATFSED